MEKIEFDKIYNMDCIEGMKYIPNSTIDLVVTDPPFAIEFKAKRGNYNRTQSRVLEGYNELLKNRIKGGKTINAIFSDTILHNSLFIKKERYVKHRRNPSLDSSDAS